MNSYDFRNTLYTVDERGRRRWVYPSIVSGVFRQRRRIVVTFLIALYAMMPWITVGHDQAIRLDLPNRRFTVIGGTFHPSETLYLFVLFGLLGFGLFFFTAVLGRIWCGWACPQTVFLEFVFRPLERLIEGGPAERRRLDQSPWTWEKIGKKTLKFALFSLISWYLASTLLAYFVGRSELIAMMTQSPVHHLSLFLTTLFLMGVLLAQFGWFREQFCSILCPYARADSSLKCDTGLPVLIITDHPF